MDWPLTDRIPIPRRNSSQDATASSETFTLGMITTPPGASWGPILVCILALAYIVYCEFGRFQHKLQSKSQANNHYILKPISPEMVALAEIAFIFGFEHSGSLSYHTLWSHTSRLALARPSGIGGRNDGQDGLHSHFGNGSCVTNALDLLESLRHGYHSV